MQLHSSFRVRVPTGSNRPLGGQGHTLPAKARAVVRRNPKLGAPNGTPSPHVDRQSGHSPVLPAPPPILQRRPRQFVTVSSSSCQCQDARRAVIDACPLRIMICVTAYYLDTCWRQQSRVARPTICINTWNLRPPLGDANARPGHPQSFDSTTTAGWRAALSLIFDLSSR